MTLQKVEYCGIEAGKNLSRNLTEAIVSSISVAIALLAKGILSLYFTVIEQNSVSGLGLEEVPNYVKFKVISFLMGRVSEILVPIAAVVLVICEMRVVINSKKKEIQLMKLVGAEDSFIYFIYILEGLAIGIIGAILAIVLLFLISKGILSLRVNFFKGLTISLPLANEVVGKEALNFFGFGIAIAILGSIIALRRTLRKII